MNEFNVRELLRQKLSEEPEAVISALLERIVHQENQLNRMFQGNQRLTMHRGWVKLWRKIEDSPCGAVPGVAEGGGA